MSYVLARSTQTNSHVHDVFSSFVCSTQIPHIHCDTNFRRILNQAQSFLCRNFILKSQKDSIILDFVVSGLPVRIYITMYQEISVFTQFLGCGERKQEEKEA